MATTRAEADDLLSCAEQYFNLELAPWQREMAAQIFMADPDKPLNLRGPYRNV